MPSQSKISRSSIRRSGDSSSGSGSGGGLVTLFEKDLTAQSALDLQTGGDGNKVIGGSTFYAANVANNTSFAVVPGSGVVCSNVGAGLIQGGVRTSPLFGIRLTDINPTFSFPTIPYFYVWWMFAHNAGALGNRLVQAGIERKEAVFNAATYHHWEAGVQGAAGPSQNFFAQQTINGVTATQIEGNQNPVTSDVLMMKFFSTQQIQVYSGVSSAPATFPDKKDLVLQGDYAIGSTVLNMLSSEFSAYIGFIDAAGPSGFNVTVKAVKIQAGG